MKVLFIYHDFPGLGGIEKVSLLLANYFVTQNIEVSIISAYANPECDYSIISPNIKLVLVPEKKQLNSPVNISFITKYIKDNQIGFIINQGFASEILKKQLPEKCKLIQVLHNLSFWEKRIIPHSIYWDDISEASFINKINKTRKYIFNHIFPQRKYIKIHKRYKHILENSDRFITLSDGLSQIVVNKFPEYQNIIQAIENPTDLHIVENNATKENEVIYAGRLHRVDKRVDRILEIWQEIEKKETNWKLRIIGDGPDKKRLLDIANKLQLKQCTFEGYHKDVSNFLKHAKVIVLSSNIEGIPMSLIEAMQAGVIPVVYNCSPGLERLIDNHKNGILIPCFDSKTFTNELYHLMNSPELIKQYSDAAKEKVNEFDIKIIGEKWIQLFNELT